MADCIQCSGCGMVAFTGAPWIYYKGRPGVGEPKACTACSGTGLSSQARKNVEALGIKCPGAPEAIWRGKFNGLEAVIKRANNSGVHMLAWNTGSSWTSCEIVKHDPVHQLLLQLISQ